MSEGLSIRPQTLHLAPQYRRLRDTILRPQLRLTESRYFWDHWKPRLGADAAILIMELRDRCNRALAAAGAPPDTTSRTLSNTLNGLGSRVEQPSTVDGSDGRDGCTISASELAGTCGFSRVTLWRLLQRDDVRRFVRVEHNYVYDRRLGKKRRTVSTYHVAMEDPLTDEDEAHLEQLVAASGSADESAPGVRPPSSVQNEMLVVDNPPPRFHPATNRGGSIPKPQNVAETIFKERLAPNGETAPVPTREPTRPHVDIWRKYPELAHYVEEAEQLLGDAHSRGFYLKALKRLYPGHMGPWQRALGMAREQTNIRRSRGALFTRLLRAFAAEAGVEL